MKVSPHTVTIAGIACLLAVLHVLPNAPIAHVRVLSTDFLDPVRGALQILEGRLPWTLGTAVHGWGRDLSYVPLVAGVDGWVEHAVRRAWLQAWVPVSVLLAATLLLGDHARRPGGLVGPVFAAALLSCDQQLSEIVRATNQSYTAVEWGGLFAVGIAGLLGTRHTRLWACVAGASLTMMVFNTPYATSAAPMFGLCIGWIVVRRGDWTAALIGVGTAALLAAPHAWLLATTPMEVIYPFGESGSLLDRMRETVGQEGGGPTRALAGFLSGLLDPVGLTVVAGLATATVLGILERHQKHGQLLLLVVAGLGLALPVGAGLTLWVQHTKPWHVLALLPLACTAVGAGLTVGFQAVARQRGMRQAVPGVVALVTLGGVLSACAVSTARARLELQATAEPTFTAEHLQLVARSLAPPEQTDREHARSILGKLGQKDAPQSAILHVHLQAFFAARGHQSGNGRVLYAVGEPGWIERACESPLEEGRVLGAGEGWVLLDMGSDQASRRWEASACAARDSRSDPGPGISQLFLYRDGQPDSDALHPCASADRIGEVGSWALGRLEVSRSRWGACVDDGGCAPGLELDRSQWPAFGTVQDATRYCAWSGGRLPTAGEWAQAGGQLVDEPLRPVGTHPPPPGGSAIEDLAGNALEWVAGGRIGGLDPNGEAVPSVAGWRCAYDAEDR